MKPATTLALVALAASLGGCKSFVQAFDFSKHSQAPQYAIGPADLEEGREQLRAGNPGNSLAPLHRAALNPQTRGEALNALGVAYAKLGRADLAERFFIAATRVDAGNERFAANLDRFYRSDLARDIRLAHIQRQKAAEQYAEFKRSQDAEVETTAVDRRMVMSGGEARTITISRAAVSPRVDRGTPSTAKAETRITAKPRVQLSNAEVRQPSSGSRPVEIQLSTRPSTPGPRVRVGSAQQARPYPLRVRLAPRGNVTRKD